MRRALFFVAALAACKGPETELLEPLVVANWYPSGNAACVDRETAIWVTFSEPLEPASLDAAATLSVGSESVAVGLTSDAEAGTLSLAPEAPLAFGSVHTVTLAKTIRAASGEELGVDVTSRFLTIPQSGCAGGVECFVDAECSGGDICSVTGACVSGCADARDCPIGLSCSAGTCQ
jgi:hypothetical protein